MGESQTSVQFTSVMAAVVTFLLTLLLQAENPGGGFEERPALRIAVLTLLVAAVAFLIGTLVYANASAELARPTTRKLKDVRKQLDLGDVISEYGGVYPLFVAVPNAIYGTTHDCVIAYAAAFIGTLGLLGYHVSGYTVARRGCAARCAGCVLPLPTMMASVLGVLFTSLDLAVFAYGVIGSAGLLLACAALAGHCGCDD